MSVRHPAKYTPKIVDVMVDRLGMTQGTLLDPFAGQGLMLPAFVIPGRNIIGVELEQPWVTSGSEHVVQGDSTNLRRVGLTRRNVAMIATSPAYGNRFADHHNAKDSSKRRSYTHDLRHSTGDETYTLHRNNGGLYHFHSKPREGHAENDYKALHREVWTECTRVAASGCIFLLNVSDYYRTERAKGQRSSKRIREAVTLWHLGVLAGLGWEWVWARSITTPRMRYGQNGHQRVQCEWVHELRKP